MAPKREYKSDHVGRPLVRGSILILGVSEVKVDSASLTPILRSGSFSEASLKLPDRKIGVRDAESTLTSDTPRIRIDPLTNGRPT